MSKSIVRFAAVSAAILGVFAQCSKNTGSEPIGQFPSQLSQFPAGIIPTNIEQEVAGSDAVLPQGILARKSAWLRHHTQINTNVFVLGNCTGQGCLDPATAPANPKHINNADSELTVGVYVTVPAGRILKADKIRLKNRANVQGTTEANTYAQATSAVIANKLSPLTTLPRLPFFLKGTPGQANINVTGQELTLAGGQYANVTVRQAKKLVLQGGFYQVHDIDLKRESSLECQNQCYLTVKADIIADKKVTLKAASGNPNDFLIYVEGGDAAAQPMAASAKAVQLAGLAHVTANIYAPNGRLMFGAGTIAQGAFIGNHVRVEPNSVITAGPAPVGVVRLFEAGTAGSIEIPGKVKLDVPACALKEDTVISIEQVPSAVENTIRNTEFKTLAGNVYEMLPRGLVFDCGVQLGINYDPQQLTQEGLTLGSLVMLQSQDGRLVRKARAEPILASNQLHATISHFTFYFLGYISNSNVGGMQVYGDTVHIAPGPAMLNDGSVWKNKAQTYRRTGNTMSLIAEDYQTDCPPGVVWCVVNEQASNGTYLFVSYIYFDGLLETPENRSWKVDIFDISIAGSPENPVYLKSLDAASGITSPEKMKLFGSSLVLSDSQGITPGSPALLQIINVADINSPGIVTIPLEAVIHDFTVSGNILYLLERSFSDVTEVRIGTRNLTNGAFLGNLVDAAPYNTTSFAILGQKIYLREWDGPVTVHTFSGTTITSTQQSQIIPGYVNIVPTANVLYTGSAAAPARIVALDPVSFSQIGSHDFSFPAENARWQLADVGSGYIVANAFAATMQNQSSALELIRFEFPVLAAIQPAEGSSYLPVNTPIIFDFNNPMNTSTLVAATNSDCAGTTIQVSADDFTTCAAMASANPTMSNGGKTATFVPVGLLPDKTYKVRLTGSVLDSGGAPAAAFTQITGWNTLVRPQVVSVFPADGIFNVSKNATIVVNFSWSMDSATLTATTTTACIGSVQVSADNFVNCAPMLSGAGVTSNENQTVQFVPVGLQPNSTYKIRVLETARSVAGENLLGAHMQTAGWFTAGVREWVQKGGALNQNVNHAAYYPSIASFGADVYVTWYENFGRSPEQVYVKQWNGMDWVSLGGSLNTDSARQAYAPTIVIAGGVPYVAFTENVNNVWGLYVKHWNGAQWVQDGGSLNMAPSNSATQQKIATDGTTVCVTWVEQGHAYVKKWSGGNWQNLGGALPVSAGGAGLPSIAVAGSEVLVSWMDSTMIRTAVWNGVSWQEPGVPVITYGGWAPEVYFSEGLKYLGFRYFDGNISEMRIFRWTAASWAPSGSALTLSGPESATFGLSGSTPYVVHARPHNSRFQMMMSHFDGSTWQIDSDSLNINPAENAYYPGSLAFSGASPWVAWSETTNNGTALAVYVKAYQ